MLLFTLTNISKQTLKLVYDLQIKYSRNLNFYNDSNANVLGTALLPEYIISYSVK